jgi:thymidylate synthase
MTNDTPPAQAGNIPVLHIKGKVLPYVWEDSVVATWVNGVAIKTEYDRESDPPSRDVTMVMEIEEPLSEPRIHRCFPAGLEELEIYRQEVLHGVHDSWINPQEDKWSYTYHQRLFSYDVIGSFADALKGGPFDKVNQVEDLINGLVHHHYTRRAQAITWMPTVDAGHHEPPCLQRIWLRLMKTPQNKYILNMNTHWRSRDAYKAAFMNMYALTDLQRMIAEELSRRMNVVVNIGRYVDISDSYHIYGSYFVEFETHLLASLQNRPVEERAWTTEEAAYSLNNGKVQLLNGKPGEPPLTAGHMKRIYDELPEDMKALVSDKARRAIEGMDTG